VYILSSHLSIERRHEQKNLQTILGWTLSSLTHRRSNSHHSCPDFWHPTPDTIFTRSPAIAPSSPVSRSSTSSTHSQSLVHISSKSLTSIRLVQISDSWTRTPPSHIQNQTSAHTLSTSKTSIHYNPHPLQDTTHIRNYIDTSTYRSHGQVGERQERVHSGCRTRYF
jgi:hypothetical protein